MTEERNFLDFLSDHHRLPSFNLPTDAVPFIARTLKFRSKEEQIEVRMSTGLEQALTQYAPGKELVVRKKKYVSGGLYLDFPPKYTRDELEAMTVTDRYDAQVSTVINRFKLWFEQKENDQHHTFISWHHRCKLPSCQHTLDDNDPRSQVDDFPQICLMCGQEEYISIPMLRPPGFAPLVQQQTGHINPDQRSDDSNIRISTRWPTQIMGEYGQGDDLAIGPLMKIRFMKGKELVNINPGKGEIDDPDGFGFSFCKKCGHLSHDINATHGTHDRPYAIPFNDIRFCGIPTNDLSDTAQTAKENFLNQFRTLCDNTNTPDDCIIYDEGQQHHRLILGRVFTTDVLVFRIPWNTTDFINMDPPRDEENLSRIAAMTVLRALLESITGDSKLQMNIEESDVGGDVRRYRENDEEGWELFIFERSDGGVGLLEALHSHLVACKDDLDFANPYEFPVIGRALARLEGRHCSTRIPDEGGNYVSVHERPCKHICSGCLLDYSTQYMERDLERTTGHHFLLYALHGHNFEEQIGISMTDDQIALCSLMQSIDGFGDAEVVFSEDEFIGRYGAEGGNQEKLRGASGVKHNDRIYTIHSPLFSRDDQVTSFSRNRLHNNPIAIIDALNGEEDDIL